MGPGRMALALQNIRGPVALAAVSLSIFAAVGMLRHRSSRRIDRDQYTEEVDSVR